MSQSNRGRMPSGEQVNEILRNASIRARICVGGLAYAGLHPESLGHQRFSDGIKLGDLPELDLKTLAFLRTPTQVVIRANISKAGHTYRTFFPETTCRDIEAYLDQRRGAREREELDSESPLVAEYSSYEKYGRPGRHVVTTIVNRDIRDAIRPKFSYEPDVLRNFFSTRLLLAVSEGVVNPDYRIYWMGQTGYVSTRYGSNTMLPDDLIEDMRKSYERCLPYLVGAE